MKRCLSYFLILLVSLLLCGGMAAHAQENAEGEEGQQVAAASANNANGGNEESQVSATEAPTATVKPRALPMRFVPPFSLRECLKLIDRCIQHTPGEGETTPEQDAAVPVTAIDRMVVACANYLRNRDDLHSSLVDYRWIQLDEGKVQNAKGTVDKDTLDFSPPVEAISALSLAAQRGDAYIHQIRVYDEKGNLRDSWFDYRDRAPKLLRHSLPRRQVFHLWRRTTISRIEIEYSRANRGEEFRPKVVVYGGITDKPEYIKTAIYYLDYARRQLEQKDWENAREALIDAREEIVNYLEESQEE